MDDDDLFLAEILAEEQRQAEELQQMEQEMKELEAMKEARRQAEKDRQSNTRSSYSKMKPGSGGGGTAGATSNMPGGTTNAQLDQIEQQLRQQEAESQHAKRHNLERTQEEANQQKAHQLAQEREAAYEAELARVTDERTKQKLKRQKTRDARIVKRILKSSEQGRHYSVLGLGVLSSWWGEVQVGPFTLFVVTPADIKRWYRKTARNVHPDKNRDGRAAEAFDALERSAAILMDGTQKKMYDAKLKRQRNDLVKWGYGKLWNTGSCIMTSASVIYKVLGPFATPITLLTLLII